MNIDDDVLRQARTRAAAEGRTLGQLITDALRERLTRRPAKGRARYRAVTAGEGGVHPGIDITSNAAVRDAMDLG